MSHILTPAATGIATLVADGKMIATDVTMFKELLERLPDLTIYQPDKDKAEFYPWSKTVNRMVDDCTIHDLKRPNEDFTDVYAWPHTLVSGFKVWSDPPYMIVGRVNTEGFGVVPTPKWEDALDDCNMNLKVIRMIRNHLKGRPAIFYM